MKKLLYMRDDKQNGIVERSSQFALKIVSYCELLLEKRKFIISRQLYKSVTSIGANSWEAQIAVSKDDFIHKMQIAAKETDETEYWLLRCKNSTTYPFNEQLLVDLIKFFRIISIITSTSKKI